MRYIYKVASKKYGPSVAIEGTLIIGAGGIDRRMPDPILDKWVREGVLVREDVLTDEEKEQNKTSASEPKRNGQNDEPQGIEDVDGDIKEIEACPITAKDVKRVRKKKDVVDLALKIFDNDRESLEEYSVSDLKKQMFETIESFQEG